MSFEVDIPALTVSAELAPDLELGALVLTGLRVAPSGDAIDAAFDEVGRRLAKQVGSGALAGLERVATVRRLFHRIGLDPTRRRPSSEALARRLLKGQDLYRVSNAVDIANICSLEQLLPMGLYDLLEIEGPVQLRLGEDGDGYDGIRKDRVHVGGRPALYDSVGPFGAPLSDSSRTSVSDSTRALLLIIYVPSELGADVVEEAVTMSGRRFASLSTASIQWTQSGGFSRP